ncbi:magnesium/cobalt transporter CorA [Robiginitalea sp. M366]|uniref:magnesium/cobalt transporter CorA n=1 Tax=Robiginitalea aestuariiviva TaxID=3036903 RepID=UPI00240D42A5|nr:magnesium/cobalt transporter CorA [Robiginitalea aestuariiviva]MDG1572953.1 magnesium/cobalt transporter CorA [Robiginitalea aestuariiviva]
MARKLPPLPKVRKVLPSRRRKKIGKAPGTITYLGSREGLVTRIERIVYNETRYEEALIEDPTVLGRPNGEAHTEWINVIGLSDEALMDQVGRSIGLNNLTVEDILNTEQRPKVDEYENYTFGVFKMLYLSADSKIVKEHLALVLTENQVFLFQEVETDVFDGVRKRLEEKSGRIRSRQADYLFFALLDAIVDNYFLVLEFTERQIDELEQEVFGKPTQDTAYRIQMLRKEIITIRGWMAPVKELVNRQVNTESALIRQDTRLFFKDILDHTQEINDSLQIQREMALSLMEMYMSSVSNRMNEVMKVLTIMASIFIPLSFIAGVYGMNFKNMPELEWEYGYYGILGLMGLIFLGLILYFRRKRWI